MSQPVAFYCCAVLAVFVTGLAKGGFSGIGALALPIMALAMDPLRGAAILMPILVAQDAISVWSFRRSYDAHVLRVVIPGMIVGVGLGYLFARWVSSAMVLAAVGLISILFGAHRLWRARHGAASLDALAPDWVGVVCGVASGFTSQLAQAGPTPYQIWVLPRGLSKEVLAGTTAMAFATMNWVKLPAYVALGQLTRDTFWISATLLPAALASTLVGVVLVRKIRPEGFYGLIHTLMILLGAKLVWDAAARWL